MSGLVVWGSVRSGYYEYGFSATVGDRTAEVLRAYPGQWFAYCLLAGHVCKRASGEPQYESREEALRRAKRFLLRETTPEVWPQGCCGA